MAAMQMQHPGEGNARKTTAPTTTNSNLLNPCHNDKAWWLPLGCSNRWHTWDNAHYCHKHPPPPHPSLLSDFLLVGWCCHMRMAYGVIIWDNLVGQSNPCILLYTAEILYQKSCSWVQKGLLVYCTCYTEMWIIYPSSTGVTWQLCDIITNHNLTFWWKLWKSNIAPVVNT